MTKKWPSTTHPSARSGYGIEEITSRTKEMTESLSKKSFEEISLRRVGDWVVSVRLGAAGDRMQSVFYSESRPAPFFSSFFPSTDRAKAFCFKSELWIWYPRNCSGFSINHCTQTSLVITLPILPFFLLPLKTPNISWDISFLLASL